jgi:sensor histidine kinase YesM
MQLIYIPLNTSHPSNHNPISSFLALSTPPFLLLTLDPLCNTLTSPSTNLSTLYNPTLITSLLFLFSSSKSLLFFFLFSLFVFFFVLFLLFVFFSSSSAPFVDPSFFLRLFHLFFHTDHIVYLSAQNTASDTSRATALSKTDRTLLNSNG